MMRLSDKQLELIVLAHQGLQDIIRNRPPDGETVDYRGRTLTIRRNVISPHEDSLPLVDAMQIKRGDRVLDLCTGSGNVAIAAAEKGADSVLAIDVNPDAVLCAAENARRNGFGDRIIARQSNMFDNIRLDERFDVITATVPFLARTCSDLVAHAFWDQDLHVHRSLFAGARTHLRPGGRVYVAQANFGAIDEMRRIAAREGFLCRQVGERRLVVPDFVVFYAFEFERGESALD